MASENKSGCFILLTIIIFAVTHSSAYGGQSCNEHLLTREFYPAENKELQQVSYRQKITRYQVICVNYCLSDPDCKSVNYHINNHLCELNNVTRAQYPDNFITHYGSVYFDADVNTPLSSAPRYISCKKLLEAGHDVSGIYTIFPAGFNDGLQVYCDSDTDGGGWIVIQRRQDGSVDFDRSWNDYRVGFGNLSGEFWLGNYILRILTASTDPWQLQIDIMDWQNKTATAGYGFFWISGDNYQLHVDSYNANSTAYDSLTYHNNMQFTTKDKDNDKWSEGHCGVSPVYTVVEDGGIIIVSMVI